MGGGHAQRLLLFPENGENGTAQTGASWRPCVCVCVWLSGGGGTPTLRPLHTTHRALCTCLASCLGKNNPNATRTNLRTPNLPNETQTRGGPKSQERQ